VRSLVNTLDNMLRFSGEIRPKMEFSCVNDIVRETCNEFREVLASGGIELDLIDDVKYSLYLDKGLIRQALINILLNSVHSMPEGGTMRISIVQEKGSDDVQISIKDNGSGMDEETRVRLFEPFFSTKDRGTGLGMSITLGIITAHKGRIDVDSFPGKGTEFIILLPLEKRVEKRA
jgi:two-component system sensor histidine kinase FlrB